MITAIQILVVEDEPLLRMDIADQLSDQGFHVFEAEDADEAISVLEQNLAIRLIITDIDMPGSMDGLKLAEAVRNRWPPVKIIVVSGHRVVEITDLPDGSMFFLKALFAQPSGVINARFVEQLGVAAANTEIYETWTAGLH